MKKKNVLKLDGDTKHTIYWLIYSLTVLSVLLFAMFSLSVLNTGQGAFHVYFSLVLFSLGLSHSFLVLRAKLEKLSRINFVKQIIFAAIFIVIGILAIALPYNLHSYNIYCGFYFLIMAATNICNIFEKRPKIGKIIFHSFLSFIFFLLSLTAFYGKSENSQITTLMVCITIIVIATLIEVLTFAFARMQFKGLLKIMKKTYAFEILYGLLMLVVSFSLYFSMTEPDIHNFGDGLWYSFSVITTIGFGDKVVVDPVSRILSVILGIYGILVVAVITSIIVNFYNETKDKEDKEHDKNDQKKKEKETKENENKKG